MSSQPQTRKSRTFRPPKYSYDFRHLTQFPRRLIFPPESGVGRVRSFKITPVFEVTLDDVLDGKHLPPITLKDFEDYLVFETHSAENLYFICWLRDYTAAYNKWKQSQDALPEEKRQAANPDLTVSFARARGTFFDPSSHLELNLPGEIVEQLLKDTQSTSTPSPEILSDVQKHVEGMLRESLMKFVVGSCRNSGRRRGLFAIAVGLAAMAVGLAPVFMSIFRGESRWVRLAALFPFWFGATTAIAGFHGVCVVIFLFGDARQLYPYELCRPTLPAIQPLAPLTLPLPATAKSDAASTAGSRSSFDATNIAKAGSISPWSDDKSIPMSPIHGQSESTAVQSSMGAHSLTQRASRSFDDDYLPETAGFIPPSYYEPSITATSTNAHSSNGSSSASPYKFDFDTLPQPSPRRSQDLDDKHWSRFLRERGVFASMTKVFSPVVTRAQWDIVMRSAILGVLVALILGGVCIAIPFKH
ncbi:hypothetical protein FRB90_005940 [Tulasnella sp. 427]|nr:hypothetical protein FRB90_005940 [Tulasnella sp. 427]